MLDIEESYCEARQMTFVGVGIISMRNWVFSPKRDFIGQSPSRREKKDFKFSIQ